jgi:uncharacterized OB-fold protein
MHDYNVSPAPQGWECPKCKRIYSPSTMMCLYCPTTTITHTSTTFPNIGSYPTVSSVGGVTITATNNQDNDTNTI